jgi:hypothetical protein
MQGNFFEDMSPAAKWDRNTAHRALDELFSLARQYKSSEAYRELLDFVARFRFYSPFNAMLVHIQMAGATFIASPHRWLNDYHRRIKAGARPLVILQPMGPVMFVFDVSDTEPENGAPPLPRDIVQPFEVKKGKVGNELTQTIENAKRDGVYIVERAAGSQSAGVISMDQSGKYLQFQTKLKPQPEHVSVPLRYGLLLNSKHSAEAKYATLVHELAHLYCGHLGSPNNTWWPDRRGLPHKTCEFEAESVCYLVCKRLGIDNPSDQYLAGYMKEKAETPSMSLDCVMKAAGLIEQMGRVRMKPRKEKEK